jgi:outer membrane biosynthesis protein TonB
MRIAPLILATSLATLFLGTMIAAGTANAAVMDPKQVTMMLAKSQALDSRCKILGAKESQDLRDLVARAEIALATKYSVGVARETLAKGRADGKIAACDATAAAEVKNILQAATRATIQMSAEPVAEKPAAVEPMPTKAMAAAAQMKQPEPQMAATEPVKDERAAVLPQKKVKPVKLAEAAPVTAKKKPLIVAAAPVSVQTTTKLKVQKKLSLSSYSDLAEKYFVELKCRKQSLSAARRMYTNVLAQHRAALATDGGAAVRKMLRGAQSRANSQSCG